jgi:hypothetical protein
VTPPRKFAAADAATVFLSCFPVILKVGAEGPASEREPNLAIQGTPGYLVNEMQFVFSIVKGRYSSAISAVPVPQTFEIHGGLMKLDDLSGLVERLAKLAEDDPSQVVRCGGPSMRPSCRAP